MFSESVRMTEGFDPLKEGRSRYWRSDFSSQISHFPEARMCPCHCGVSCTPSQGRASPPGPGASRAADSRGFFMRSLRKRLLHPDWPFFNTQCFPPVPRLLRCLFAMGVARSPKTTGEVWLRSSLLWRTFFESFIWQNGKNSWPGNSSEDTDSYTMW